MQVFILLYADADHRVDFPMPLSQNFDLLSIEPSSSQAGPSHAGPSSGASARTRLQEQIRRDRNFAQTVESIWNHDSDEDEERTDIWAELAPYEGKGKGKADF